MMTTKQRIERIMQEKALTTAHNNYEGGMNSYASFKVGDHATSQDLVQDTFMKTWRYLIRGGKINLMKPFLYHILNQLIIDEYRRHKTYSLNTLLEKGFEPSINHTERIFNILDGKTGLLLIKHLPVKYQRIMRMRYIQDLSLKEISLITGQSKNTVAVQAHRGLTKLKKIYHHQ